MRRIWRRDDQLGRADVALVAVAKPTVHADAARVASAIVRQKQRVRQARADVARSHAFDLAGEQLRLDALAKAQPACTFLERVLPAAANAALHALYPAP